MRHPLKLAAILWGAMALSASATVADEVRITVTGWGAMAGPDDRADARARAITDALGRAVERAGRTVVAAEAHLVSDLAVASSVSTESLGVVTGFRIVGENLAPGGYHVRLVATVAPNRSSPPPGGVSVLVVAQERYLGTPRPWQPLGPDLARQLRASGFVASLYDRPLELGGLPTGPATPPAKVGHGLDGRDGARYLLVAWAEARPSDRASSELHSARARGAIYLHARATGHLLDSRVLPETLGWGASAERAGGAALDGMRRALGVASLALIAAAVERP
jgi:hypothetical protein